MKLLTGGKDIIELVESITWSGDTKEVSRKLSFVIYQNEKDKQMPKVSINAGDDIILQDDKGKAIFGGVIHKIDRNSAAKTMTYLAYDLLFYVSRSEISKIFDNTPESITKTICDDLGIPTGSFEKTGIKVYYPCLQKTAYDAIMIAYTYAGRTNGKVYIPLMKDINKLCVIKKGQYSGVVVEGTYNLEDATYSVTSENVVNQVVITDKNGNTIKTLDDLTSRNKYGTVQKVYKQEDGADATTEAKALFHGIDETGTILSLGDTRAVSGYSLAVQESKSGLYGLFYIESDSHTFANGKHEMSLTLAFENTMDEKDIPSE